MTHSLVVYFKERFPLAGVLLISLGFAFLAAGVAQKPVDYSLLPTTGLFGLFFAAFLLRQRVTDEFKDLRHDTLYFPNRPLQRGAITRRDLIVIGGVAMTVEFVSAVYISGIVSFGWYCLVLLYSLLMAKEFFVARWLESHFTLYFVLHEVIFIWIGIWILMAAKLSVSTATLAWVVALVAAMSSVEVARKYELRRDSSDQIVKDTYLAVWGEAATRNVLQLLIMTSGIALAYFLSSLLFAAMAAVAALTLSIPKLRVKDVKIVVAAYFILASLASLIL